ncbi:hypothetical protein b3_0109 [Synechococcus phage B3]|jgi:hypothetical protein|nr:hypothetical protein b3_0109 [Synechococcus phage B3]QGT54723.1 hypothetical protein b23_0108 [Synechococcus phage B23]
MTELETLVFLKKKEWQRAYEAYHTAFMSVVDNEIECDFVPDAIPRSVMDHYHRAFNDYTLASNMLSVSQLNKNNISYFGDTLICGEF